MKRAIVLLGLFLSPQGCGDAARRAGDSTRSGTVVIAELGEVGVLLPVVEQTALDAEINDLLYLGLNSGRWEDGELIYVVDALSLADRWEFAADSATLTYFLRPDAVWSDGTPLTSADVVFTYELARDTLVASPHSYLWANLDSVAARDERTVTFFFKRQNPDMLFASGALNIVPRHIYGDADRTALRSHPRVVNPAAGNLVVSGPYTVGTWAKGSQITLVPNPRAFTGPPSIERVVFRVIPEESTRLVELLNGAVDVTWPISFERARQIEADPQLRLERVRARYYDFLGWNPTQVPAFRDSEVRRALSLAIDRETIVRGLDMQDFAMPAAGPYPPIFRRYHDPALRPDPYLPDSARAILRRGGWRDRDGDGALERNGRPLRFTLTTNSGNARRESAAQMIQAQLKIVGADVRLRLLESNTFFDGLYKRQHQAPLAGWQVSLSPDLTPFFHPDQVLNVVGYDNPRVTAWMDTALAQPTAEAAAPYWRAVARAVADDRPYAFLYYYDGLVGVNERVQNTRIDTYGVYQNLYEWRLEAPRAVAAGR